MSEIAHYDPTYPQRLAEAMAEMPANHDARIAWYRRHRRNGTVDLRVLRHAFWGRDNWWDDNELEPPAHEYLQNIEPGWMWVRIDNNSRRNYITSSYALNLADPAGEIGRADWHPMCWQVPLQGVHPRARDCIAAQASPLCGKSYFVETWGVLGDRGVVDVRGPLHELGHPAG